jgi:hypothetical protein
MFFVYLKIPVFANKIIVCMLIKIIVRIILLSQIEISQQTTIST